MTTDEDKLSADIKGGTLYRVYYFYGEEIFLTETYTKRILAKTVGNNADDINLTKLSGTFSVDTMSDSIESMPLFAESKAVLIKDLDCDKFSDSDFERITDILQNVPPECTVIISMTGISPESGKKSKNKALLAKLSKYNNCTVCNFKPLPPNKVAELIIKKASRRGCVISRQNAVYLAGLTLNNLTLCSNETEKLCDYKVSGEITAEMIDRLAIKQLDTKAYFLANTITAGKSKEAFMILDDLLSQRIDPIVILASLSSAYFDYYRAMLSLSAGNSAEKTAADFGYAKNRAFVISKAMNTVSRLPRKYITGCISELFNADIKMKTSGADNKIVLEKTIAMLFYLKSESMRKRN